MLIGDHSQDIQEWRKSIKHYEKDKRTKKPFGKEFKSEISYVTEAEIKQKDQIFNPVLQNYSSPAREQQAQQTQIATRNKILVSHIMKSRKHNDRSFDIINLHGEFENPRESSSKVRAPIRNLYNPINNRPLPDFHFKGRDMRLPLQHPFKSLDRHKRDFNIVTGQYKENNDFKKSQEMEEQKSKVKQKYWKSHLYDPVFGRFYDQNKQEEYDQALVKSQMLHGRDHEKKLPPSYQSREPYISDPTKPLPDSVKLLDKKKQNAKRRYKLKYLIEQDYEKRNLEDEQKKEIVARNRIHNSHAMQMKAKQFDLSQLNRHASSYGEELCRKEEVNTSWDKLAPKNQYQYGIKSAGFS